MVFNGCRSAGIYASGPKKRGEIKEFVREKRRSDSRQQWKGNGE
jgi:hypothetical protein